MIKNFLFGFGIIACIFVYVAVVIMGFGVFLQISPLWGLGYMGVQLGILAGFLCALILPKWG